MEAYALHEQYSRNDGKSDRAGGADGEKRKKTPNPYTGPRYAGKRGRSKKAAWDRGYKTAN